jgi:hypothetical protein
LKGNCQGNSAPKEISNKTEMKIKLLARKQEIEGRKEATGPRSSGIIQQQLETTTTINNNNKTTLVAESPFSQHQQQQQQRQPLP